MAKAVRSVIFSDYFLVGFIGLVFFADIIAWTNGWTLVYSWIDQVSHFSGGFWAAIFFVALFFRFSELQKFSLFLENKFLALVLILSFVALIGISWEFFEFVFNVIGDLPDTMNDLFLDLVSGFVGAILSLWLIRNRDTSILR